MKNKNDFLFDEIKRFNNWIKDQKMKPDAKGNTDYANPFQKVLFYLAALVVFFFHADGFV